MIVSQTQLQSSRTSSLRLLVILNTKLWEYDIFKLINNSSSYCNSNVNYIWRNNTITELMPTDFGIIELNDNTNNNINVNYNEYKQCLLLQYNHIIKYITIDKLNSKKQLTMNDNYIIHRRDDGKRGFKYVKINNTIDQRRRLNSFSTLNENVKDKKDVNTKFIPSSIAKELHKLGYTGKGIKVAVFDTGLVDKHPHFKNINLRTDWTTDNRLDDTVGHGSFCAGIIAGTYQECSGLAPDSEILMFRVFTSSQATFTSWFLDSFNYVMYLNIDILNLSIGGPDHADRPFIDKIHELSSNGIIVVSAVGNDGPSWGTQYNPADMADVLGVGGWDLKDHVSSFSSRGMTTWDLPRGFGHVKPDIIAQSEYVYSSQHSSPFKCRILTGTSVAAPVVTGALALLLSTIDYKNRKNIKNIAAMKQLLMDSASKLSVPSIFEQGAGVINITSAFQYLQSFKPHVSMHPRRISNFAQDCPYMWPWCTQSIYVGAQPFLANLTILNSIELRGKIKSIEWVECVGIDIVQCKTYPAILDSNMLNNHAVKSINFNIYIDHSDIIWPWSGYLGISIVAKSSYVGNVFSELKVTIETSSDNVNGVSSRNLAIASFDLSIIQTPPREKRLLWDIYHSISYPSAFVPKDDLLDMQSQDMLDWNTDHPYLNFRELYIEISKLGYFVEILRGPWTCFDANQYQALLIIDTEEDLEESEIFKIENDINKNGLSIIILAEWYDELKILKSQFNDENTRSRWYPITGGSNIIALNRLLSKFDCQFGLQSFHGEFKINDVTMKFTSGNTIAQWPGSYKNSRHTVNSYIFKSKSGEFKPSHAASLRGQTSTTQVIIGLLDIKQNVNNSISGRIIAYGDTTFFDKGEKSGSKKQLKQLLSIFMNFISDGIIHDKGFISLEKLYYNENLLGLGKALTLNELKELDHERKGRIYEYSRYSKYEYYHWYHEYISNNDICSFYS